MTLARTAALKTAFAWFSMNRYAVSSRFRSSALHTTPHSGAKWPFTAGRTSLEIAAILRSLEKTCSVVSAISFVASLKYSGCDGGGEGEGEANAFSQTLRSARPWATLARRATVHGVLASRSLS